MTNGPNEKVIVVRADTYAAMNRIRLDESYPSFDEVIRKSLKITQPRYAFDL